MTRDRYLELLAAGPEFTAEEVPGFLGTFRPRLSPMARAVRGALVQIKAEAVLARVKALRGKSG